MNPLQSKLLFDSAIAPSVGRIFFGNGVNCERLLFRCQAISSCCKYIEILHIFLNSPQADMLLDKIRNTSQIMSDLRYLYAMVPLKNVRQVFLANTFINVALENVWELWHLVN